MDIVFLILKIIGIALLCVLGLLLLAILLVLFVPLRYRIEGKKEETLEAKARVTWLLHFVNAELSYAASLNLRIKILGICFYDRLKKKAKEEKKREKEQAGEEAEEEDTEEETAEEETAEDASEDTEETGEEISEEPENEEPESEEVNSEIPEAEEDKKEEAPKVKKSLGERMDDMADAFEDGLDELEDMLDETADSLEDGIDKIREKIEKAADTIGYYLRILESDGTQWVYEYVVRHVKACIKNVVPKRIDAKIRYSDDDPASVAGIWQIYAVAVTLLGSIKGKRELITSQDDSDIRFNARIKGRATVAVLAYHGLCLLLNKKVKKFIKLMKREDKTDGRK